MAQSDVNEYEFFLTQVWDEPFPEELAQTWISCGGENYKSNGFCMLGPDVGLLSLGESLDIWSRLPSCVAKDYLPFATVVSNHPYFTQVWIGLNGRSRECALVLDGETTIPLANSLANLLSTIIKCIQAEVYATVSLGELGYKGPEREVPLLPAFLSEIAESYSREQSILQSMNDM